MSDGTGYGIQAGEVGSVAGRLDTAADEVGTVKSTMPQEQCSSPASMGGEEAAPAFDDFVAGWQREATVLRDALKEISRKLNTTTNNYTSTEQGTEARLRRAAPTQAGLSDFN